MISIVIAEDHIQLREMIARQIEEYKDFKVVYQADNGAELILWLESTPELPDLCISDMRMPLMNGEEMVKHIVTHWPGMKVLMLSSENSASTAQRLIDIGARGYLNKSGHPSELRQAILSIHETGYFQNPKIEYQLNYRAGR